MIKFLNKLGGTIKIQGRKIIIYGKKNKKSINHKVIFDRIEAGTYMIAAALVGKKIKIDNIDPKIIKNEIRVLKKMGIKLKTEKSSIEIKKSNKIKTVNIVTKPYPGFPTDLQAQLMVLMTRLMGFQK